MREGHVGIVGRNIDRHLIELGPERLGLDPFLHQRIAYRYSNIARGSGRAENKPPLHADLDRQHPGIDMALARRLAEGSLQAQTKCRLITARSVLRICGSALANVHGWTIDYGV